MAVCVCVCARPECVRVCMSRVCGNVIHHQFFNYSCDTETTICLPAPNATNQRSAYTCVCNLGYYVPNQTYQGFEGHIVETGSGNYSCIRCPNGCGCDENGLCSTGEQQELVLMEETLLHFSIGAVLGACMLCCVVLAAIVFRQRKSKVGINGHQSCFAYIFTENYDFVFYLLFTIVTQFIYQMLICHCFCLDFSKFKLRFSVYLCFLKV